MVVYGLFFYSICSLLSLSTVLSYVLKQLISKSVPKPACIHSQLFAFNDFRLEAHK